MNSRIQHYVNRFKEIYHGDPWYGENIQTKLKDCSPDIVFRKPGGVHSIAELVSHITYWRRALLSRLEGDKSFVPSVKSADNWVDINKLKALGWDSIRSSLELSQEKITTLLSLKDDNFLGDEYLQGKSFDYLIQAIIDHDIYHLGQIGLVRKLCETMV